MDGLLDGRQPLPKSDIHRARLRLIARLSRAGWHPDNVAALMNCHRRTVERSEYRVPADVSRRDDRLFEVA